MKTWIKTYWKIGLCFIGVFLAGAVAGGVVMAGVARQAVVQRANPKNWQAMVMRAMDRRLALTPEQQAKIEPMVAGAVREIRISRAEFIVKSAQSLNQLKTNVATVLDEKQQKELEKMSRDRQRRWQQLLPQE